MEDDTHGGGGEATTYYFLSKTKFAKNCDFKENVENFQFSKTKKSE
jgi:hypothetical protein